MWFIVKDLFVVVWYVLLFTIAVGITGYFIYYRTAVNGLSARSLICLGITVIFSFIFAFPFFGAIRARSYVKNIRSTSNEVVQYVSTQLVVIENLQEQDLGALLSDNYPMLSRYIPALTVQQLMETGQLTSEDLSRPDRWAPAVTEYFFGRIQRSINLFAFKMGILILAFIIIPFIIFYRGVMRENREALQRRMRMMGYD